ncbi:WD40-repeat-containing domain protein [Sporodiniella umbellata]|nr:WD40-repeat-containing domain protein [Sporodiniella umbellata]
MSVGLPEPREESTRTTGSSLIQSSLTTESTDKRPTTAPLQSKSKTTKTSESRFVGDYFRAKKVRPGGLERSTSAHSLLDTRNEDWLKAPIDKRYKGTEAVCGLDRVITTVQNIPSTTALFSRPKDLAETSRSESYNALVAKACGSHRNGSILSCEARAPEKTTRVEKPLQLNKKPKLTKRKISESALKCLDAPYMIDDYYLNLLDWSSTDIVAVALDKSVYLWNSANGTIQALNYDLDHAITSVSFSADSTYLAVGIDNGDTQIWDFQANKKLRSMAAQSGRVSALSWNRHVVSSGYRDGSIFDHDVRIANHLVREMRGHEDEVCGLKWRPDGGLLASGANDNTVNIWDARRPTPKHTLRAHNGAIKALAWSPWSNHTLATGGGRDDKRIIFWDATRGSRMSSILTDSQVTSLHWSSHYQEITSTHGFPNNHISVWEYPTKNKIASFSAHDSRILHSALSPDGEMLATAAADDNVKFWRLFDPEGKARLSPNNHVTKIIR